MSLLVGLGSRLHSGSGARKTPQRGGHGSPRKLAHGTWKRSVHAAAFPPFVAPVCFDQACQATADRTFLLVVGAPLLVGALWLLYGLIAAVTGQARGPGQTTGKEEEEEVRVTLHGETGCDQSRLVSYVPISPNACMRQAIDAAPAAWRVQSYTPLPVGPEYLGQRVKLDVGQVGDRKPRWVPCQV